MGVRTYSELVEHTGHNVECAWYGDKSNPHNVAVECMDCYEVLLDYDNPDKVDRRDTEWYEVCKEGYPMLSDHIGHKMCVRKTGKYVKLICVNCEKTLLQYSKEK